MKLKLYFLIAIIALCNMNANAQNFVEDATKLAALVPGLASDACKLTTKPCVVTSKATDRTITVKIEETFIVNNELHKKTMVFEKLAPGEKRFIGCAGTIKDAQYEKSTGYKILLAYYDAPDSVGVRAILSAD